MNWNQRTNFWTDFTFQVHVLENIPPSVISGLHLLRQLESFWLETDSVPGMSTWSKLSGFINSPEVIMLYINSCFHIIVLKEKSCEKINQTLHPTVGFFCRGSGRILNWKCRSESKEGKIQIYILCSDLSLIQILVYSNHYIHQKINHFIDIVAKIE